MGERRRGVMGVVFLTAFLDMVGFSVIFPLFPAMLRHYLELEGEASAVGSLKAWLSGFAVDDWAVVTLFGGVLGSIYSLMQFLAAPLWGALSDRHGRRAVLLVTLAGTAVSYLAWAFAGTFLVLVGARLLGGLMAGNLSIVSAAVADTHEGPERAKGMGHMGAAIGLGFVVGPGIGGLMAGWSQSIDWGAAAALGLNPFSGCALAALALASLNLLAAWRRFPETHSPEEGRGRRGRGPDGRTLNPLGALRRLDAPGVARTNLAYFVYFGAFGAMEFTLTFLAVERLGFDEAQNAWMFVFVGLLIAFVQGGLVRRLAPRHGERRLASAGMVLTLPGFVVVGLAHSTGALYAGLAFLAVGSAFVMPCLSALVSRYSPADRQGLALGVFRSLGSLARAIGPLAGGLLYWKLGSWGPYYVGAVVLLVPLLLALRLPPVPEAVPEAGPGT